MADILKKLILISRFAMIELVCSLDGVLGSMGGFPIGTYCSRLWFTPPPIGVRKKPALSWLPYSCPMLAPPGEFNAVEVLIGARLGSPRLFMELRSVLMSLRDCSSNSWVPEIFWIVASMSARLVLVEVGFGGCSMTVVSVSSSLEGSADTSLPCDVLLRSFLASSRGGVPSIAILLYWL